MMNRIQLPYLLLFVFIFQGCASFIKEEWYTPSKKNRPMTSFAWIKNLDPDYDSGNLPIALNSPAIYNQTLFIGSNQGKMLAYDLPTGRLNWSHEDQGPYHASSTIHDGMVIYGTAQGRLLARKVESGELVYEVELGASVESTPVISKGRVLVHLRNHRLFCLDATTGKILWGYKRAVPFLTTLQRASTPVVIDNKVIVGFADGSVVGISLEDGVTLWENTLVIGTKFIDVDGPAFEYEKKVLIGSALGGFFVIDPINGRTLVKLDYSFSRTPLVTAQGIYLGTHNGELVLLDRQFKEIKNIKLSEDPIAEVKFWNGYLVVASVGGELYFLDANKDYARVKVYHLGHSNSAVFGNLASNANYMAYLSSRNRLYVLRN